LLYQLCILDHTAFGCLLQFDITGKTKPALKGAIAELFFVTAITAIVLVQGECGLQSSD
jgi:hypothetical protein